MLTDDTTKYQKKYRGLSYEELTARQIAQGDTITDLKQRKWSEEEGVKRPALEAKAHAQEDFEEKALEGATLLHTIDGNNTRRKKVRYGISTTRNTGNSCCLPWFRLEMLHRNGSGRS